MPHVSIPPWDPDGPVLLREALAAHLELRIQAGEFAPGDRLPPERELATEYGVSAPTVRSALDLLRRQGRLKTIHGKGTYVLEKQDPPA